MDNDAVTSNPNEYQHGEQVWTLYDWEIVSVIVDKYDYTGKRVELTNGWLVPARNLSRNKDEILYATAEHLEDLRLAEVESHHKALKGIMARYRKLMKSYKKLEATKGVAGE